MTKTILAEAARLRSAVQTKSPLSWDSSEAHGEAGVISYRANIIALPYRAQPLASGNRLIGISKKSPAECGAGVRGRGLAYLALFGRFVRARSAGTRRPLVIC